MHLIEVDGQVINLDAVRGIEPDDGTPLQTWIFLLYEDDPITIQQPYPAFVAFIRETTAAVSDYGLWARKRAMSAEVPV